jgi:hypothetical protein
LKGGSQIFGSNALFKRLIINPDHHNTIASLNRASERYQLEGILEGCVADLERLDSLGELLLDAAWFKLRGIRVLLGWFGL